MGPLTRFFRRRKREIGVAFATLAVLVLGFGLVLPEEYVAVATVAPDGAGYQEPVARYVAEVDSAALLRRLADPESVGVFARLAGVPRAPEERLRVPGWARVAQVRNDQAHSVEIEVRIQALNGAEALRVADGVAAEIVRLDALSGQPESEGAPFATQPRAEGPSAASLQAALTRLRAATPGLRGEAGAQAAQLAREEADWERRRETEQGIEARLTQELAHVEELRERVLAEARAAWEAHKAQLVSQAREAARRAAPRRADPPEEPQVRPQVEGGPLATLEAELRLLLASRTLRHPEVRNLLRRIDLERARLGANGPPAGASEIPVDAPGALPSEPAEPSSAPRGSLGGPEGGEGPGGAQPAPPPAEPAPGAAPAPPETGEVAERLVLDVADDDAPAGGYLPVAEAPVPAEWIQRAPSYPEWAAARDRSARTRADLESALSQSAAMRTRLDRARRQLKTEEAALSAARLEEARLLELLGRAPQPQQAPRRAQPAARPHLQASPARLVQAWRPSEYILHGIGLAAFLALLLGWSLDWRDPAIHEIEDVAGFGVPVLGVIPHLK